MKHSLFALLALTTCITQLPAAEIAAPSKVDAVTVYPVGAEITRVTNVDVAAGELVGDVRQGGDNGAGSLRLPVGDQGLQCALPAVGNDDDEIGTL